MCRTVRLWRRDAALVACLAAAVQPAIDRVACEELRSRLPTGEPLAISSRKMSPAGDVRHPVPAGYPFTLGALPGTRRGRQYDAHQVPRVAAVPL